MGAGLDWKTSLQELSALHDLGVPEYVIEDEGPDHMKTFTARVRVADRLHGRGRRSVEEGGRAAGGRDGLPHARAPSCPTPRATATSRPTRPIEVTAWSVPPRAMPELPEVEVVRAGLEAHVLGRPIVARRGAAPPSGPPSRRPVPPTSPPG